DEAKELRGEYLVSKLVEIAAVTSYLSYHFNLRNSKEPDLKRVFSSWHYWLLVVSGTAFGVFYFFQYSDFQLHRFLNHSIAAGNINIHFANKKLTTDEEKLYIGKIKNYASEI